MLQHETYMHRCLQLALMGMGNVAPNPMVGAVLVYENKIIGEGYHREYGKAHAEVNCINSVSPENEQFIDKSILYVSLEPCAHYGKTPPCSDLIIEKKIPSVVIACEDSYKKVNGKGIEKLLAAGVNVTKGVLEKEAINLNKRFFTFHNKKRPYIILKWAQSADGYIANKDSSRVFISNDQSNQLVHKWRSEEAAIMVGTNTALLDDPLLTNRHWPGKNPVRIVIDLTLKLPAHLNLLDGSVNTIVFNSIKKEIKPGVLYQLIDSAQEVIPQIATALYEMKIQSVIIEGGTKLLQSFIDIQLWDEARVITNDTMNIIDGHAAPCLTDFEKNESVKISNNTIDIYHPKNRSVDKH